MHPLQLIIKEPFSFSFATSHPSGIGEATSLVAGRVTPSHLGILAEPFSKEEVEQALFQMHPTKAPGADGLPALLYQKFWHVIGDEVAAFCLQILSGDVSPGRLITDNALIAYECFHYMKKRISGRNGIMALKLDMSKAYDRIEWSFLESVLLQMGFPVNWVRLIMNCVTSVSFSIMLNGNPQEKFFPQRGLRQGDPLSPYLFILCGEVFSAMIEKSMAASEISGIKISRHAPVISHLLFADDSVLFARATMEEAQCIKNILGAFERAYGQRINFDKSMLSVSRNVHDNRFNEIKQLLQVKAVGSYDRYLGLPTIVGKSKTQIFNFVKERVWKKLKGWKEKFLSRAGREVLIKSVVQAIPSYVMSCFILPDGLCADIDHMISRFYWGGDSTRRGLHWTKWENLCKSKVEGGLGFRDVKSFNMALVGKNWWRIYTRPESLVARIFKGAYFPRCSLRDAKKGYRPSYTWSSILKTSWVFERGGLWKIGDGSQVHIWNDNWVPGGAPLIYNQDLVDEFHLTHVSMLIDHALHRWRTDLIELVFNPSTAARIISIPLGVHGGPDEFHWPSTSNGHYTCKEGYKYMRNLLSMAEASSSTAVTLEAKFWNFFWSSRALPRCKETCWRAIQAKHVWFASQLAVRVASFSTFRELWLAFLELHDEEVLALVQSTVYAFWEARNHTIFQQWQFTVDNVLGRVRCLTEEVQVRDQMRAPSVALPAAWKTPTSGTIKCNFDASYHVNGSTGLGMVARNCNGEVMAAACSYPLSALSPLLAEAMSLRWTMQLAIDLGFRRICLETDCLQLYNCWKAQDNGRSYLSSIIREWFTLRGAFDVVTFSFVRRTGNAVADFLARNPETYANLVWVEEVPEAALSLVISDVTTRLPNGY
ncbi:uncharacterized protein LOC130713173 [Lotus japonicus]|uniref:uncharacterized protein LOC130713173 n=1 Tax=Lotus japonicus TaxID=34305 RepID=UPI002586FFA2|nr:uncharacterized protein LOC130713173 [Lotus japonicus]